MKRQMAAAAVALCSFGATGVWAQTAPLDQELDQKIPAALAAAGAPSVSVAVIRNGRVEYTRAFGKADIAKDRPATIETRYAVGSISKQFTAAGLLLEQEQGKLSLDDKVSKYYPDLTRADEVTIRELLSHTSGYEDYAPQDYLISEWTQPITPDEILNRWAKKPLNFDPGTEWQYSNTNYVLAGKILEKVSGEKLLPFLEEHFFRPLGMSSAGDCTVYDRRMRRRTRDMPWVRRVQWGAKRPVGISAPVSYA